MEWAPIWKRWAQGRDRLSITPLQGGFWATKCPVSASHNPSISYWCFLLAKPKCNKGKEIVNVAPTGQSPGPQHSKEMKSGFRGEHRYPAQRLHTVNKSLFVLAFINRNDRSFSLKFKLLYLECYPQSWFQSIADIKEQNSHHSFKEEKQIEINIFWAPSLSFHLYYCI